MDVALDNTVLAEDNRGTVTNSSHSPFALALIEGLQDNRADLIPDGVITAHELYLYLEQRVSELSKQRQNPGLYPLRREYDRGEFIFTKPEFTRDQLKPAPPLDENNNPYRGLKSFDEKHAGFFFGRQALIEELAKRLLVPNQPLTVVLGVSGSGKSSLVKAGLIPYLRDKQAKQWYILEPMRPGELPFTSLARVLLPVVNANLLEQLSQVSFLDEALKQVLEFKTEADQDLGRADQAKSESDRLFQMNETLIKVAQSWCSATPEARLLLVEDYLAQLETLCRPEERQLLVHLHDEILARLDSLLGHLQQDPQYLIAVIETWSQNHPDIKLLLVIDQFEELITASHEGQTDSRENDETGDDRTTEPKQWQPFLEMLRGAIAGCPGQWRVVLTLRSDFEPRFLDSPLKSYWKDARFPVRAMNSDELRQAIEGPALKQALYFEPPELVGKLIDEVGQMPGALPLLSFSLSELYIKLRDRWVKDNASDRALRIKDYEELGGVAGALTRRATEEYNNLVEEFGKAHQTTMRRVMLRMVAIEGGGVARRRVLESELVYADSEENKRVAQVSDQLVKARLLVKGQEIGEAYLEPAHDFLVRGWDKLQEWVKDDLETLALRQRLTPASNDWHNHQDEGLLLPDGDRLNQLEKILKQERCWLNQLEIHFIQVSLNFRDVQKRLTRELQVRAELQQKAARVMSQIPINPLEAIALAIEAIGQNLEELPNEMLAPVQRSLHTVMNKARIPKITFKEQGTKKLNSVAAFKEQGTKKVNSVAFHPNGQYVVSGSRDRTLRLWNWEQNLVTPPFVGHEGEVNSVLFGHNGQYIISGSDDGTIRLWNFQLQPIGKPFVGHQGAINSVVISPDGQYIVSGGADGTIRFWNLRGESIRRPLTGHKGAINSVAISPDGQYIASGGADNTIRLWNSKGKLVCKPFAGHQEVYSKEGIYCVFFSPNSQSIASCGADATIRLWSLNGDTLTPQPLKHFGVCSIAFSPDGHKVASAGDDSTGDGIRLWTTDGRPVEEYFSKTAYMLTSIAFSPNGDHIVTGENDGSVKVWGMEGDELVPPFTAHENEITTVIFSPDGQRIASSSFDKTIKFWDLTAKQIGKTLDKHTNTVSSIDFSPDGEMLVSGSYDQTIRLWNLRGEQISSFGNADIRSVAFSPNGQIIASTSLDGTVNLWNLQEEIVSHLPFGTSVTAGANNLAFSPDGQRIACKSTAYGVRLWDWQENSFQDSTEESPNLIKGLGLSPDGQKIVTGDVSGAVCLWDCQKNLSRQRFQYKNHVYSVCFSPDGQTIISGSSEVVLWDTKGNIIATLQGSAGSFITVARSQNGGIIAAGGGDGTIHLWRGNWRSWLQVCCERIRNHSSFKNPQTDSAKAVCEICKKYVWDESASDVELIKEEEEL